MAVGMLTEGHLQENATTCRAGRQFALVSLDPALLHVMISPPEVLCRSWMDDEKSVRIRNGWRGYPESYGVADSGRWPQQDTGVSPWSARPDGCFAGEQKGRTCYVSSEPDPAAIIVALADLPPSFSITDGNGVEIWKGGQCVAGQNSKDPPLTRGITARTDRDQPAFLHIPEEKLTSIDLLLLHEAQHRSRNLVSLVISLAHQSLAAIEDEPLVRAFVERLRSLDAVARIGCEVDGDLCPVPRIVRQVEQRLDDPLRPRITQTGPDVAIAARWAHLLAIVLHELTANALRHGALSIPQGRVDLRWVTVREAPDALTRLVFTWREQHGPPVLTQGRTGFGMRVLRDLIGSNRRCTAVLRMLPSGLVYELSIRLGDGEIRE
jgi:two-component sensor histidine kinase